MKKQEVKSKELKKKENKKNSGITLIALVITIIVLLILAGVTIATLTGENGILTQAQNAKTKMEEATKEEEGILQSYDDTIGDILEGEIWKLNLDTIKYSTDVNINVFSKYNQGTLPETLKGYKELYILRELGEDSYSSMDEYIMSMFDVSSMKEVMEIVKEQYGPEITRDQFVYEIMFGNVTNEDEALKELGFTEENIKQIELEYQEKKEQQSEIVVPERYINRTYTITYPNGTTQTVEGKDLKTFKGKFKVDENNNQYTIKIEDNENNEEVLKITVNNFVKYQTYDEGDYTYNFEEYQGGYSVRVKDKTLTEYGEILPSIYGIPVVSMDSTFKDCNNMIKSPQIPDSVTDLQMSYWRCTKLVEAPEIPDGVTDMNYTFDKCIILRKAPKIPNTVTDMSYAFAYCEKLTEVPEIPNGVTSMTGTFNGCTSLIKAPNIPDTVVDIANTFQGCTNLEQAPEKIPETVENMWDTFYGCSKLKEIPRIPSRVTKMMSAFKDCTSLSGKVVIDSVKLEGNGLGDSAFENAGTNGSGLIVIVPNDEVRNLLIQNSKYNSSKVKFVKSEDEIE